MCEYINVYGSRCLRLSVDMQQKGEQYSTKQGQNQSRHFSYFAILHNVIVVDITQVLLA